MAIGGLATDITATTIAAIVRSASDVAAYRTIFTIADPAGHSYGLSPTDGVYYYDGSTVPESDSDWVEAANGWMVVAVTKTNGTVTPRFHRYTYSSTTWEHQDSGDTADDPTTPTGASEVYLGASQPSFEGFACDLACVGYWPTTALSDGNIETLENNIANWEALSPASLWLLNQTNVATSVDDRTGTSDQTARVGTTVLALSDLPFEVGGGGLAWIRA